MIPSDFVDELLSRTDIVDLIEQYVPLKKGGQNYMACCPFHKEKTPSFTVSPNKQFYHCFGCGAHGTAIGFVMAYQGSSFVEAVEQLASQAGMVLPKHTTQESIEVRQKKQQQKLSLENIVNEAARFYQKSLKTAPIAINYLKNRGLTGETAAKYGLGYAPESFQALSQTFSNYSNPQLVQAGLVIEKEGKYYDRFRGRVMFPIRNGRGQTIGFGGRILDKGEPKYLNSPETPLFFKGKELYGLYEAKSAIKDAECILVVEGYMDVVSLSQAGVDFAVACLGTATTPDQIKLLMRQSEQIYFCFDGDKAGKRAAWRALENALPLLKDGIAFNFLFLPEEHDPDSFVKEYGAEAFKQLLKEKSEPLSDFFVRYLSEGISLQSPEGKAELIKYSSPLLNQIKAQAFGFLLKQKIASLVDVELHDFELLLGQKPSAKKRGFKNYQLPKYTTQPLSATLVQRGILSTIYHPDWVTHIDIPEYLVLNQEMACLATLIEAAKKMGEQATTARLIEYVRESRFEQTLTLILQKSLIEEDVLNDETEEALEAFVDGIKKLLSNLSMEQIDLLKLKDQQTGLDEAEKKLLLNLLMSTKN